jgi:CRISPR-associated protein Csm1
MLARASRKLVDGRYLVEGGADLRIGDTSYGLSETGQGAIYALDGVGDEACLRGATPMPAARYAMRDDEREDQIMDFDKLSGSAAGASRLAVLRMDVDDLGEIFRIGLPQEMRSLDRYAALSRAFTTFFKMIVPKICAGNYENGLHLFGKGRERAATVVYSGGDDLFVVGAWSDVLELAIDIRRAFREFVCENPAVTLSGGVSIHTAGEPLYLMAEQAGVAEELAKSNEQDGRKKDSIVLFYRGSDSRTIANSVPEALFWDEVENGVVTLLQRINEFRKDGELPFPRGFTRLLMDVVDVYEQEGHLSLPRLAYALARMEEGGKLKDDERWQELKKELLKVETVRKYLRPAAYWLDLAERKGE